jgi:ABC-type bacteriocin/lantibiotic exporter with double-glycine peptidase domain
MDCGATCLAMVAKHYGKTYTIPKLREMCSATRGGVSLLGISDAAEKLGVKTMGVRIGFEKLAKEVPLPCIVHWRQEHFVVVYDARWKAESRRQESRRQKAEKQKLLDCFTPFAMTGMGRLRKSIIDIFTMRQICKNN